MTEIRNPKGTEGCFVIGQSQEAANSQKFIMGSDAAEFVNRVNDQVRKRQKIGECLWLRR